VLFDDFARQPLLPKLLSQLGPGIAWADLDGDGQDELVVGTGRGGALEMFRRESDGTFRSLTATNSWQAPDDVTGLAVWFAATGERAVLAGLSNYESAVSNSASLLRCRLRSPAQTPGIARLPEILPGGASPGPLAVADLEGDGDLDLFVGGRVVPGRYPQAATSQLFRQDGDQLFPDSVNNRLLENLGLVAGAVWTDLDLNGYPELVLAGEWGPVRIFRNARGNLTEWDPPLVWSRGSAEDPQGSRPATPASQLSQLTGWWSGVNSGDFDGDGQLDLVAGNWGLNDAYETCPDRPLQVYFGDLNRQGIVDVIEAYYPAELDTEMPRRSLNALSLAFPFLREHYPTHAAFSTVTLAELLQRMPAKPERLGARFLASVLFLNRGSHFVVRTLPAPAQWAPVFAVNVADLDGDGHEDVFLSQNFFATRMEWPRLDAGRGLWLRGDGQGNLQPVPGQVSGIQVDGEQRGAALGDFNADGRVDLAVTQNGSSTVLYENTGARPALRVHLTGPLGNPCGIGAILRVQSDLHAGPAREIHAGAGYWSQDSLVQVLASPAAPARIEVRWPGGQSMTGEVPPDANEIAVDTMGRVRPIRNATRR
jgi:hypothetical protein